MLIYFTDFYSTPERFQDVTVTLRNVLLQLHL